MSTETDLTRQARPQARPAAPAAPCRVLTDPLTQGYHISYITAPGGYHPPHWHEELEIMYHLNGDSDITIDGKRYRLLRKHMTVIDSRQVHSTYTRDAGSMFVSIHISKEYMERYIPGLSQYQIRFTPDDLTDENFRQYLEVCMILQDLTRTYLRNPPTLSMETEAYVLKIFAKLVLYFSQVPALTKADAQDLTGERIRSVINYVAEHYRENVGLADAAAALGFSREYFCRFFKKAMGMSFLQYLNAVRIVHVYEDLKNTDHAVSQIMEDNGFTNQKLFNRTFKEVYGCTPTAVRRGEA